MFGLVPPLGAQYHHHRLPVHHPHAVLREEEGDCVPGRGGGRGRGDH